MDLPRIVPDTNAPVAGLRSRRGASFRLLQLLGTGRFEVAISVPLILEYEDVLMRHVRMVGFDETEIAAVIDYLCAVGQRQRIFYLWRPVLRDPKGYKWPEPEDIRASFRSPVYPSGMSESSRL
jgi:predicted nucleic acid-binding protein